MHATRRIRNTGDWKAARMLRAAALCWRSACPAAWLCGRARQETTTGTAPTCGGICNRARTGGLPSSATAEAFISTTARSIRRRTVRTRWSTSHLMRATRTETWRGLRTRWRRRMLRGRSLCWAIGAAESDLIRRMAAEGHLVCNHSYAHRDMTSWSADEIAAELTRLEDACREAGVETAKFFRPPEGRFSESLLRAVMAQGYRTVFGLRLCRLGQRPTAFPGGCQGEDTRQSPQWRGHPAAPTSATNAEVLPALLAEIRAQGYRFGTLYELTGVPEPDAPASDAEGRMGRRGRASACPRSRTGQVIGWRRHCCFWQSRCWRCGCMRRTVRRTGSQQRPDRFPDPACRRRGLPPAVPEWAGGRADGRGHRRRGQHNRPDGCR